MTTSIYTKQCIKCKEIKSIDEFYICASTKDKLRYSCKECCRKYHHDNKEQHNEQKRQYYIDNKEQIKQYRAGNKERIKQYYIDNKEQIKQYRADNKERIKEQRRQHYIDNQESLKECALIYRRTPASYETYIHQLTIEEEPRLSDDGVSLEVRCKYCGKYFTPTNQQIMSRSSSIKGSSLGEHSIYCSDNCKKSCGTYNQNKYPKGFKTNTSREVQPQLRKLVLERDDYTCQSCDNIDDNPLHCHHYEGIELNPIESADIDNCITLCKTCHNTVHKYCDMRRKNCI